MAKAKTGGNATAKVIFKRTSARKRTSIGNATASRPKNKAQRRNRKQYRGQGKP